MIFTAHQAVGLQLMANRSDTDATAAGDATESQSNVSQM